MLVDLKKEKLFPNRIKLEQGGHSFFKKILNKRTIYEQDYEFQEHISNLQLKGFSHRNFFFFCFYNVILLEKLCKKVLYSMAKLFFNQKLFHFFCQNVPSSIHSIYGILYTLYGSECRFFTLYESDCREEEKKRQNMAK